MVALLHLHCCIVDSWHSIPIRLIGATAIAAFGEDELLCSAFYQHQCSRPDTLLTCWTLFEFSNSEQKLLLPVLTLETLLALTLFGIFRPGQTWRNICHEFPTLARMCVFPFGNFQSLLSQSWTTGQCIGASRKGRNLIGFAPGKAFDLSSPPFYRADVRVENWSKHNFVFPQPKFFLWITHKLCMVQLEQYCWMIYRSIPFLAEDKDHL